MRKAYPKRRKESPEISIGNNANELVSIDLVA
jgi:hypothetical protein